MLAEPIVKSITETVTESPSGYSLVNELAAANLAAFASEGGGVRLSPTENVTDAIRERMKPHKNVLRAYLDWRQEIEAFFPLSWPEAAMGALPDACPRHVEARGFCYREPEMLGGAKIIVAKNDCDLCPWYLGVPVFYECELPGAVDMGAENAQRLLGDKARLFPAWSATGWWSEVRRDRVSFLARAGRIPERDVQNLLGYLVGLGIVEEKNDGGQVWRLVVAERRGMKSEAA